MNEEEVEQLRGQWVAVDEAHETLVAFASSLEGLYVALRETEHPPVVMWRLPTLDEPIYMGLV
jgi:hypothetical protein